MSLTRREALATATTLPAIGANTLPEETAIGLNMRPNYGIIDFRVRPPFRSFRRSTPGSEGDPGDEELMERFLQGMGEANIEMAVVMGRTAPMPGPFHQFVANDDIAALIEQYPGRFFGFGSVDIREPQLAIAEVARCAKLGLRGIAFDNPLSDPPVHNDDPSLMPIYEACVRHGLIIAINASGAIGPELSFSDPVHVQKVANAFPTHPIVVTHGAWPYTREMVAIALYGLMLRNGNIYFQIDYALLGDGPLPGARDYIDAVNLGGIGEGVDLYRKALFGSSYPAIGLSVAAERFARLDLNVPGARRAILRDNAAGLLAIQL